MWQDLLTFLGAILDLMFETEVAYGWNLFEVVIVCLALIIALLALIIMVRSSNSDDDDLEEELDYAPSKGEDFWRR